MLSHLSLQHTLFNQHCKPTAFGEEAYLEKQTTLYCAAQCPQGVSDFFLLPSILKLNAHERWGFQL